MPEHNNSSKDKIQLEDLLKFKKHEQPDQAFWESFDRELQEKTLQVLVQKPSFLSRLANSISNHGRVLFPATTLAVLTLVFFAPFENSTFKANNDLVFSSKELAANDSVLGTSDIGSVHKSFVLPSIDAPSGQVSHVGKTLSSGGSSANGVRSVSPGFSSVSLATAFNHSNVF